MRSRPREILCVDKIKSRPSHHLKKVNAERVSFLENSHFHEDRPHGAHSLLENRSMTHFQREVGGTKILSLGQSGRTRQHVAPPLAGPYPDIS